MEKEPQQLSAEELRELTRTRCWLEERALRESMASGSREWEEGVVLAWHRLSKTPRSLRAENLDSNPEWDRLHRLFHRQLILGCGSRWLLSFCEQLADQHHRYRRLSAPRAFAKRAVSTEHRQLVEAAIAGQADTAVDLLRLHFERTATLVHGDKTLFAQAAR